MRPTIYLAFVDDWELSGNGSGDVEELQLRPMRKLVEIYERHGIHGSFNAEVMQQLAHRRLAGAHPELGGIADAWDEAVCETYARGHDVQLHIHPQWRGAQYADGRWRLTSDWSILNYSRDEADDMFDECRSYLSSLLKSMDSGYECVSFRSGAWCIAPSPHMLGLLADRGIVFDMSIVGGIRYDTRNIQLDYTDCGETFLPYYPVMTDARRVSTKPEKIVCVPTNHFYGSRRQVLKHHLNVAVNKVKKSFASSAAPASSRSVEAYGHEWAQNAHASTMTRVYEKGVVPYLKGKHLISDIAQLDYPLLKEMLTSIRRHAAASGLEHVPVVLENHTKDIRDFTDIERFVSDVSRANDVECITLTDLANGLKQGKFHVKTSAD
jgi:hypothetical protein